MLKPKHKQRLTELAVRKAKPKTTAYVIWDTSQRGLGLRVQPTGSKSWVFIYTRDGRSHWFTLGATDTISLDGARTLAAKARLAAVQGGDPAVERVLEYVEDDRARAAHKYAEFFAQGVVPLGFLYHHFDHCGDLIYVGITADIPKRQQQHLRDSGWNGEICFIVTEPFATREEALTAEKEDTRYRWPKYNIAHNRHRHPVAELRRIAKQQRKHARLKIIRPLKGDADPAPEAAA